MKKKLEHLSGTVGFEAFRINVIYGVFENEYIRHICSYMGISMVYSISGCDTESWC